MKIQTIRGFGLIAGAVWAASNSMAHALEASDFLMFSRGAVSLRPQVEVQEQFNDNLFFQRNNKQSDLISIFAPGVRLLAGDDVSTANHLGLRYRMEQLLYLKTSSLNALQHHFTSDLSYSWTRLKISGSDQIDMLSGTLGGGISSAAGLKVDRTYWTDSYRADYRLGERTGVYVVGRHNFIDYDGGFLNLFDTRTTTGTGGFEYRLGEETYLYGETYYGFTDLETNVPGSTSLPDRTFYGAFLGARGNFTEKLRGNIKAGYELASFSRGTGAAAAAAGGDTGNPVVDASLSFSLTDKSSLALSYSRRESVSVQFVRSAFTGDSVSSSYRQFLGSSGRLRLDVLASYSLYSYEPLPGFWTSRDDTHFRAEAGISYFFEAWLSSRLEYNFEKFDSTLSASTVNYTVNRVTLSMAVGY
jgi:polysaccharide biosynthesis protein VpsM